MFAIDHCWAPIVESKARIVKITPQWSLIVKATRYEPTTCELTVSCQFLPSLAFFSSKKRKTFNGGFLFQIKPHKWRAPTDSALRDAVSVRLARVSLTVGQTAGRKRRLCRCQRSHKIVVRFLPPIKTQSLCRPVGSDIPASHVNA
jgi:hypothetical protein